MPSMPLAAGSRPFANLSALVQQVDSKQGAHVLGRSDRFETEQAAFANGALIHALDFDDTHGPAVLHPTAVSLPAAMAVGDEISADTESVFLATLAGVEITCRVGMAQYNQFHLKGFHPTSTVGTISGKQGAVQTAPLFDLRNKVF